LSGEFKLKLKLGSGLVTNTADDVDVVCQNGLVGKINKSSSKSKCASTILSLATGARRPYSLSFVLDSKSPSSACSCSL
jgi:hypothetical protein